MGQARIGKVRLKDGATVLPIRKTYPISNSRRDNFMRGVSDHFEEYVSRWGYEPDAIVFVLGGIKQVAESSYVIEGISDGGEASMRSLAISAIQRTML